MGKREGIYYFTIDTTHTKHIICVPVVRCSGFFAFSPFCRQSGTMFTKTDICFYYLLIIAETQGGSFEKRAGRQQSNNSMPGIVCLTRCTRCIPLGRVIDRRGAGTKVL